jgi:hypothetical protein
VTKITATSGVCVPTGPLYDYDVEVGRPFADAFPTIRAARGPIFYRWQQRAVADGLSDPPAFPSLRLFPKAMATVDFLHARADRVGYWRIQIPRRARRSWFALIRHAPDPIPREDFWDDE